MRLVRTAALALAAAALALGAPRLVAQDTTQAETRAPAVDEWYSRRLLIHRVTAYTIPPLFAAQWYMGQRLYDGLHEDAGPPDWVRPAHRTGAALIGTAFAINATTGLWNLWAARNDPQDRVIRTLHGVSMLVAAGGFTYAGTRLADEAETSNAKRDQHRAVALGSMGLTLASGVAMWWVNR